MEPRPSDPHVRLSERRRLPELEAGRFGRMFPELAPHDASAGTLMHYGDAGGPLEARNDLDSSLDEDNPRIPAGWPFFGQFIAHDITHDRTPLQEREDLQKVHNFRSPRLDLECIYGAGPVGQPYLYDIEDPDKLLIGHRGAKLYVGSVLKRFPDMNVTIEDMVAEGDKVVVRNIWRCTDPATGKRLHFGGIVIWRVARGQIAERWAYLESPKPV